MRLAIQGNLQKNELKDIAENTVQPLLERIEGVASTDVNGGANKEIKVDVSTKLDLLGVSISRAELYRIENFGMIVKDFELIALCIVLDLNYNDLKKLILNEK